MRLPTKKILLAPLIAAVATLYGCQQQGFSEVTDPPQVQTLAASVVTPTSCTLNGEINPNGYTTTGWFEWGSDGNFGHDTESSSLGNGAETTPLAQAITGLNPNSTYLFRIVAENQGRVVYGQSVECITLNPDTDNDGLNDSDEITKYHTNPTDSDTDKDGLSDGDEVNIYHTDPLKADTDGDGLSDGYEVTSQQTDPLKEDTDGDGLSDSDELSLYNTNPALGDTDGDKLDDGDEVNIYHTDPLKADTDGDGLSDGSEIGVYGTDPLKTDTDGDGLSDGDEVDLYHTDPLNVDTDGDTASDGLEVSIGSDPLKAESTPPDLILTLISGPSTATLGQNITTTSTVRNLGGSPASNIKVDVYLSVNSVVPDGDDVYLGSYTVSDLSANHVSTTNAAFAIPASVSGGNYHIGAVVDATNNVVESDETNNSTLSADVMAVGVGLDGGDQSDGVLDLAGITFDLQTDSSDVIGNVGDGNPGQPDGFATKLTANASAGDPSLTVASTSGFVSGDEVLVIQVSHATNHGVFEFIKNVTVKDSTTLLFSSHIINNYYVDNTVTDRVEVVRVPHYSAVTVGASAVLTTEPYSHSTGVGGIIALRAATMVVDGMISADALGFEGGPAITQVLAYGIQGRSYTGVTPGQPTTMVPNKGGGGNGRYGVAYGAAGGGYGTKADDSHYSTGGEAYGDVDLARLYLGSGGGGGGTVNCSCAHSGGGGAGGGIIYVAADSISGVGTLSAAGKNGHSFIANAGGAGGGGSGGSVRAQAKLWSMSINVAGGKGGAGQRSDGLDKATDGGMGRETHSIGTPDLLISKVEAPLTATRGDVITVSSTVGNQEVDAATAPFRVGIYASTDPVITEDDIFLGQYTLSGLTGNASTKQDTNITIPTSIFSGPPGGYQYRKKIAIHAANGSDTMVLRDFPVLIDIIDSDLKSVSDGGRVETGYDIKFTDMLGAELNYEIEEYDGVTGHFRAWVKVPQIAGGIDTDIYLYYGNAGETVSQQNVSGTWNERYKTVFHQDETPGVSPQLDSTANGNDAPDTNMAGVQNVVDAVIGKGIAFDGINDYQRTQSAVLDTGASDWTLETWVKLDSVNVGWGNLIQSDDNPMGQRLLFVDANDGNLYSDTGGQINGPGQGIPLGAWNHVVLVHDQAGDRSKWYINGAWVATNTNVYFPSNNGVLWFGLGKDGSGALDGVLDEIRVSDAQRSPEWIKAEYENMTSPSTFYSVGVEESAGAFSTQHPFYIGAIADYADTVVELNEFNNAEVTRDTSGIPQVIIVNQ